MNGFWWGFLKIKESWRWKNSLGRWEASLCDGTDMFFLGNSMTESFSDMRYEKGSLWGVERSGWLIILHRYHSCFLTLSSHLLSWKLTNSFLGARSFPPSFATLFFFLVFKVEYSIQSSCRPFFFPSEFFLIPRLQAFVSIYQPSSHISRNKPSFPPPLPAISPQNVFLFLFCAASVRP